MLQHGTLKTTRNLMIRNCQEFCKYCIVILSDYKVTNVTPTQNVIATQILNHLAK